MAALPYLQLYVADYLADTAHLSTLEHGAYLLLIMNYWQRGEPFSAKDQQTLNRRLASVARMDAQAFDQIKETLAEFFVVQENTWVHPRIERDLDAVRAKSTKAKAAGKASAMARLSKRSTDAEQTLNHIDTDTDTDTEKEKPTRSQARARFVPPTVDQVRDYCTERGNTINPEAFVDHYTANGWRVGKTPMKDWQAAIRTWEKRHAEDQRTRPKTFDEKLAHLRRLSGEG